MTTTAPTQAALTGELSFSQMCEILPPEFSWGDALTPDVMKHIVSAIAASEARDVGEEPLALKIALDALWVYQSNWDTGLTAEYAQSERIQMECACEAVRDALNDVLATRTGEAAPTYIDLQNLADKLLAPREIVRNKEGWLYHPDYPVCDEGVRADKFLDAFGIESHFVGMDGDADEAFVERYFDDSEADCTPWTPTPPHGGGWMLLEIYPTEDGPYALFARRKPEIIETNRQRRQREQVEALAARNEPMKITFPTVLRKMWSGTEVQAWLDDLPPLYVAAPVVEGAPVAVGDAKPTHGHRSDYFLLANARRIVKREYQRSANWVVAMELFGTGSTSAHQICRDAGIDPDGLKVVRADLASDAAPASRATPDTTGDADDAMDTLVAVLNAIGYTEAFAEAHPGLKVSESVKQFLASQAAPSAPDAQQASSPNQVYVECRQCDRCGHIGINDSHDTDAACGYSCGWTGPSPVEDKCPGCQRENVMGTACPKCSGLYSMLADGRFECDERTEPQSACDVQATAAHAGASDEADMFWSADDGEQFFHSLDDAIVDAFNNDCGEVGAELEFTCAARLPNAKVRITGVTEDGYAWEEVAAPTPDAAKGGQS